MGGGAGAKRGVSQTWGVSQTSAPLDRVVGPLQRGARRVRLSLGLMACCSGLRNKCLPTEDSLFLLTPAKPRWGLAGLSTTYTAHMYL